MCQPSLPPVDCHIDCHFGVEIIHNDKTTYCLVYHKQSYKGLIRIYGLIGGDEHLELKRVIVCGIKIYGVVKTKEVLVINLWENCSFVLVPQFFSAMHQSYQAILTYFEVFKCLFCNHMKVKCKKPSSGKIKFILLPIRSLKVTYLLIADHILD